MSFDSRDSSRDESSSGFCGMSHAVTMVVEAGIRTPASRGTPLDVRGTGFPRHAADSAAAARMPPKNRVRIILRMLARVLIFCREVHMSTDRRSFLTQLGAGVTAAGVVGRVELANAQSSSTSFKPAKHAQDDWMDKLPGKHRMVFDTTTPAAFGAALLYAANFSNASKDGYGLGDQDNAMIIIARHFSTPFAYNDAMWAKYGKLFPPFAALDDPKTKTRPSINLYA